MSTNKTKNLGLHAWEREDRFRMDEFNENFDKLDQAVAAKAEQTGLDAEIFARKNALDTERVERQSADAAEIAARNAAIAALTERVGALETGKLVWTFGEYTGNGKYGSSSNYTRIEFDFKPLVVVVCDTVNGGYGGYPWLYGTKQGHVVPSSSPGWEAALVWEERAVRFYLLFNASSAEYQLNYSGRKYKYFALGIEE